MRRLFFYLLARFYEARHRRALDAYVRCRRADSAVRDCEEIARLKREAAKYFSKIGICE